MGWVSETQPRELFPNVPEFPSRPTTQAGQPAWGRQGAGPSLQPGLFSHYVAWEKDLPPPSLEHPLEALLADVSYAGLHLGVGAGGPYGRPVHLNFQFRSHSPASWAATKGQTSLKNH